MAIAHSLKFEYEYHQGCAKVFLCTAAQTPRSQPSSSLYSAPMSTVTAEMQQSFGSSSLSQAPPLPPPLQQTGSSYTVPVDYTSWPQSLSQITIPFDNLHKGDIEEQPTAAPDNAASDFDIPWDMQPPDPAFPSPFTDFSEI
jgi:hypothetical protein